jgi:tetratricopeptide (TPR) repeat protein
VAKKEKTKSHLVAKKTEVQNAPKAFWERPYFFGALIFCFSFLLFANSIPNDYSMDDELVTMNHRLTSKGISAIPEIFTSPYYQDESGYAYEYRPVVLASFAIEHEIFGDNPHWGHFWNVILYSLSCVMLYKVLKVLFRNYSPLIAVAVCLLFAAHPAHTEVVCSIKNRDEVLGLLFSLLSCYFALKTVQGRLWAYILVPVFFLLALMSKITFAPFAVIIPLAIFLFEDFSLGAYLFIVLSLVVPIAILSNLGDTMTKLLMLIAGAGIAVFAYTFKYFSLVRIRIAQARDRLSGSTHFDWIDAPYTVDFKRLLRDIRASFASLTFKNVAFHVLLLLLYFSAVYLDLFVIRLIMSCVLVLLLFEKRGSQNWLTLLVFYTVILLELFNSGLYIEQPVVDCFSAIAAFYLLLGRRSFFIPSILALAMIAVMFTFTPEKGALAFIVPLSIVLMVFLLRFRFGWLVALINFVRPVWREIQSLQTLKNSHDNDWQTFIIHLTASSLVLIFFVSIYLKKFQFTIAKLLLVILLLGALMLTWQHQKDTDLFKQSIFTIHSVNIKVTPKTEYRPIQYVESFIDAKTPQSIRIGTSFEILFRYLTKTIVPYPLSFYYGYSFITPMKITDTVPLISLIVHILLLAIAILFYRRDRLICFGIALYLISIAIFSNYVLAAPGMIADRFLLIPSLGWIIVLVVLLMKIFKADYASPKESSPMSVPKFARFAFIAILCLYSLLTFSRNSDWKNYLTLFEHDIKYVENSAQAHNLLAIRLMKTSFGENVSPVQQLEYRKKAAVHFRRAIEIYPPFFNPTYDLARTYQLLGDADSAILYFKKTFVLDSGFTTAAYAAGDLLMQQNKPKEAIPYYKNCIRRFPQDFAAYDMLNRALLSEKDPNGSILVLKKAVQEMPENSGPYVALARVYHSTNNNDSTRYWLQRALEINPADQQAKTLLQMLGPK